MRQAQNGPVNTTPIPNVSERPGPSAEMSQTAVPVSQAVEARWASDPVDQNRDRRAGHRRGSRDYRVRDIPAGDYRDYLVRDAR